MVRVRLGRVITRASPLALKSISALERGSAVIGWGRP
jgi:hypothetical protein